MVAKPISMSYWKGESGEELRDETVGALLRHAAETAPDTPALVEGVPEVAERRRWTYAALLDEAERAARALLGRFSPGERVAVWANNIPEWVILELAAALADITLVTVNPALRASELQHVLGHSRAAGVFLRREYRGNPMAQTLDEIRPDLPNLRTSVLFEDWKDFCAEGSTDRTLPQVDASAPAQIQYTSGTTGVPKGVVLNHRAITNNARLAYVRTFGLGPGEPQLNPMPLFHTAGCVLATLASIIALGTHVLPPHFDPGLMLNLTESERCVVVGGVPTMLIAMLEHPSLPHTDLSSLRYVLSGGATVPPELVRRVEQAFGVPMSVIYAQTEASPGITITRLDNTPEDRAETVGRPLPRTEVKIVDAAGEVVPTGVTGELCTRGYHVMTGYLNAAADTAAAIDTDGWLHTGDLGSMDDRGYCRIEGRLKDMIIRGGENIYPREIEQTLAAHPAVAEAAVIGLPDPVWGERVAAFIRRTPGSTSSEKELFDHVRTHLAPHKTPRTWVFVDAFPLTGSGKIRKNALREAYVSGSLSVPSTDI
ncbi:AMP-binding protein [Streptomyces sp. NPDC006476]|uniref:AMP-binding protein n=1 Tax=Streptomyces sp. NPDC006476 TaxID=3157175 RepID=UPI0033B210C8